MGEMDGKTVLITGATNGIGKVAALELAKKGAHVVIVGRNPAKTADTVAAIKAGSSNPNIESILADLTSMAEVRKIAATFLASHSRLDVLINNAGAFFSERRESVDGYEMTFAGNHLAYFLLTNLLLDTLKASAPARIVNVSSNAHGIGKLNFDNLNAQNRYGMRGFSAYGNSKLANVMFTYALARRLEGTGVTANVLHPGFVRTGMNNNNGVVMAVIMGIIRPFFLTPEQGADTIIYLASSPEVEGVSGKYWEKRTAIPSSQSSYDVGAQERLWAMSEQMTGLAEQVGV